MAEEKDWISVCPNCGLLARLSTLSTKAVKNSILCPGCNYRGLPIEVKASQLKDIQFKNAKF